MRLLFAIDTLHGQAWYDLFYFLALLLAGVLFILEGRRRQYPMAAWSLIFLGGATFLIIGTKLMTYSIADWQAFATEWRLPYTERKTILGGILGGVFGIWIMRRLLRFPHPVLDSFAVSFPVAMGIQRIGCYIVGCCFGTPTDLPWGVTYGPSAHAYHAHIESGLIDASSAMSLPVHPSQLYQALLCFLIAFAVWRIRSVFRMPGNLFLASIGLYLMVRFGIEFWRSPETTLFGGDTMLGLKGLQWSLLLVSALLLGIILRRESRVARIVVEAPPSPASPVLPFAMFSLFILWIADWLTPTEFLFVEAIWIPAMIYQAGRLTRPGVAANPYAPAALSAFGLLLLATTAVTAQKLYKDLTASPTDKNVFHEFTLGYGNATTSHYHDAPGNVQYYIGGGCDSPPSVAYKPGPAGPLFIQQAHAFGAGYRQLHTEGEFNKYEWGTQLAGGWDKDIDKPAHPTIGTFDVAATAKFDLRWFGAGIGLHGGRATREERKDGFIYTDEHQPGGYFGLSGSLRLFPYDIAYAEVRINEILPFQAHTWRDGTTIGVIGTGFGLKNGTALEIGTDFEGSFILSGRAFINNRYGIRASLHSQRFENRQWHVPEIGLTYRMHQRHK